MWTSIYTSGASEVDYQQQPYYFSNQQHQQLHQLSTNSNNNNHYQQYYQQPSHFHHCHEHGHDECDLHKHSSNTLFEKFTKLISNGSEKKPKKKTSRQKIEKGDKENSSSLYQKTRRTSLAKHDFNQKELYDRYKYQQKAEREFNKLQGEVKHIQSLVAANPSLQGYYSSWLRQAKHALKEYSEIIESPDSISFSSVFGYSKDQELVTVYRHPLFNAELHNVEYCPVQQQQHVRASPQLYQQNGYPHHHHGHQSPNQYTPSAYFNSLTKSGYTDETSASFNANQLNYYVQNYYEYYKDFNKNNRKKNAM